MRPNNVETAVQWSHMLHAVVAGLSGHSNSTNNIGILFCFILFYYSMNKIWIFLVKKKINFLLKIVQMNLFMISSENIYIL